jgi:hypothetical protein
MRLREKKVGSGLVALQSEERAEERIGEGRREEREGKKSRSEDRWKETTGNGR